MLGVPPERIDDWFRESELNDNLRTVEEKVRSLPYSGVFRGGPELYVILRSIRPKTVIETGVGIGLSSAYILEALNRNQGGRLVSVDLPNADKSWKLPPDTEPGFLVPESVRGRWQLRLGNVRELLPMIIKDLGVVDLFLHDSEHTYETMMFEYQLAFSVLSQAGVIISDDAMWNTAWLDFVRRTGLKTEFVYHHGNGAPFTLARRPAAVSEGGSGGFPVS